MRKFENIDYKKIISEADVEFKIIIPILKEMGFSEDNIYMRHPVKFKQGKQVFNKEADIVIKQGKNNYIVVESKSIDERINDGNISQLDSYAFGLECKYGILCNGRIIIIRKYLEGNKKENIYRSNILDINVDDISMILKDQDLMLKEDSEEDILTNIADKQAFDFATTLKQIHQDIRNTDKLDPIGAFDGWSKLLFMKIYEEKWTLKNGGLVRFSYEKFLNAKKEKKAQSFIDDTFDETKKAFPRIFKDMNEKIGLSIEVIEKILEKLDGQKILDIPYDIKGKAFEIFLSSTFRGKGLGQYFTPREVVNSMVKLVGIKYDDVILDPACGTGGFLIGAYNEVTSKINSFPNTFFQDMNTNRESFIAKIKENNFYGIDAEPKAAKTAKMNMIMWGDGENVFRGNGLDVKDINGDKYPFKNGEIDIILANPPFGSKEDKEEILKNYYLYKEDKSITKTECLFIERAIKLLRNNGKLAIVLPDAILGSDSMKGVRDFIKQNTIIKAVISLPKHTFSPSGVQTINSSVLYVEKKDKNNIKEDYEIFMGIVKNIGYDATGKKTVKKNEKNDFEIIVENYRKYISEGRKTKKTYEKIDDNCFIINYSLLEDRIDSRYYWFNEILESSKVERVPLKEYVDIISEKIDPQYGDESTYSILSVTNRLGIILNEDDPKKYEVPSEEFNQKYKIAREGQIVYNPYRIDVGSIGIVEKEYDGLLVSPAYVVFKTKKGLNEKVLLSLFKHPFYQLYIDIIATGSIRNNFSAKYLKSLKIPKRIIDTTNEKIISHFEKIDALNKEIELEKKKLINEINPYAN